MITFLSLFLGLVFGTVNVELIASSEVKSVLLKLDGARLSELHAPWKVSIDLGAELMPHELEAIALDADGRVIARAHQWINRPRSLAEAGLTLEPRQQGGSRRALRLTWRCVSRDNPISVRVTLDGKPLAVVDAHRIELPRLDPAQLHFVRAELDFGSGLSAVAELSLGGTRQTESSSLLTAFPILLKRDEPAPPVESLQGWITSSGAPARAMAIDRGPADVVFVLAGKARLELNRILRRTPNLRPVKLGKDQRFRFSWCAPLIRSNDGDLVRLFPATPDFTRDQGGVIDIGASTRDPRVSNAERIADAVAVAALTASERNARRAVVLIVGPDAKESSALPAAQARRFLTSLKVPLFVWSIDSSITPLASSFGAVVDASTMLQFGQAVHDLSDHLDRQRIVWLDGTPLPQTIDLTAMARASGISLPD